MNTSIIFIITIVLGLITYFLFFNGKKGTPSPTVTPNNPPNPPSPTTPNTPIMYWQGGHYDIAKGPPWFAAGSKVSEIDTKITSYSSLLSKLISPDAGNNYKYIALQRFFSSTRSEVYLFIFYGNKLPSTGDSKDGTSISNATLSTQNYKVIAGYSVNDASTVPENIYGGITGGTSVIYELSNIS